MKMAAPAFHGAKKQLQACLAQPGVAGLQADPVHRRQMPHRVALVAVQHQLGLGRGARGEVQEQRVVGPGRGVGDVRRGRLQRGRVVLPARRHLARRSTDHDARVIAGEHVELGRGRRSADHVPDGTALEAVGQIVGADQRGGGHDHRAQLHARQHGFPQRHLVGQQQHHAVPARHAQPAQPVGHLRRALGHAREAELVLAAVLVDDPQRGCVVAAGQRVEVIERPVEFIELGPAEIAVGGRVVLAMPEQEIARGQEGGHAGAGRCGHALSPCAVRAGNAAGGALSRCGKTIMRIPRNQA